MGFRMGVSTTKKYFHVDDINLYSAIQYQHRVFTHFFHFGISKNKQPLEILAQFQHDRTNQFKLICH